MVRKSISLGFVIFGAGLLYTGYERTQSIAGELSDALMGGYSAQTMVLFVSGGVLLVAGTAMFFSGKNRKR